MFISSLYPFYLLSFTIMNKLIDLVISKLHPGLEYNVHYGIGDNLDYCYTVSIENLIIMYDPNTFNPIYKNVTTRENFIFSPEKLQNDLINFAGVEAKVMVNY